MSSSTLKEAQIGHFAPENGVEGAARPERDPYAGTLLGELSAEMRAEVLRSITMDENEDRDLSQPVAPRVAITSEPFTLDTYPDHLREEILAKYGNDFDDAVYPMIPQTPTEAEQEQANRLRAYLGSMGRNRRDVA